MQPVTAALVVMATGCASTRLIETQSRPVEVRVQLIGACASQAQAPRPSVVDVCCNRRSVHEYPENEVLALGWHGRRKPRLPFVDEFNIRP